MASTDQRMTVLEVVNEVRRLIGLNPVTTLTADKQSRVALRLVNKVVSAISNSGDWHEMLGSANVTAVSSVREYSLGLNFPVKNIFEVAISGRAQSLDPIGLSEYLRYARVGGVGTPAMFTIKGVDNQTNPKIAVHPQPVTAQAGNVFQVTYFRKPPLYLTSDADTEIPFAANLVIEGLYAACLEEETRESLMAARDFQSQNEEELNRYNADAGSGSEIQMTPIGTR